MNLTFAKFVVIIIMITVGKRTTARYTNLEFDLFEQGTSTSSSSMENMDFFGESYNHLNETNTNEKFMPLQPKERVFRLKNYEYREESPKKEKPLSGRSNFINSVPQPVFKVLGKRRHHERRRCQFKICSTFG